MPPATLESVRTISAQAQAFVEELFSPVAEPDIAQVEIEVERLTSSRPTRSVAAEPATIYRPS